MIAVWLMMMVLVTHPSPRHVVDRSVAGFAVWRVTFSLAPQQQQLAVLYVNASTASEGFVVRPLPANETQLNYFGYRRAMQPLH